MNNINCVLEEKANCVGCRACMNICPANAITMQEDEEGFFYPVVDSEKCTNCGLCKKACPSLNKSEVFEENKLNPDCYAVMADDEIRLVSSSGGAFTLIANWILEQGGYVCGVAFVGQKVQHIIIDNKEELYKLRGSKYVQSDTNTVYSEVKKLLKNNKLVLFTGTPCQVAGLNVFLGKKYEKLYTIDVVCHGVPSQKLFNKYLNENIKEKLKNISFRNKSFGWNVHMYIETDSDNYFIPRKKDDYLNAFLNNMCLRPSCGNCKYCTSQREADLTIGDYWAVERYDPKLNDNKGTTLLLLNSLKAKFLHSKINYKCCVKTPIKYATWYNWTLYRTLPQHPNRETFFKLLNKNLPLNYIVDYCRRNKYDCSLLTTYSYPNYGGILTSFALFEITKKLNYNPIIINNDCNINNKYTKEFSEKYLKITKENIKSEFNHFVANSYSNTVIVGSDCNWSPYFHAQDTTFLLSWVKDSSKKISYSTSFGMNDFLNKEYFLDYELMLKYKFYLNKFDHLSVREETGIQLLQNLFKTSGECVLDPVFLLDKNFYISKFNLCKKYNNTKILFKYCFFQTPIEKEILHTYARKNNYEERELELKVNTKIENWVQEIYSSNLFITNSYHGVCFALIFNKNFICYSNKFIGKNRVEHLLKIVGLEDRLCNQILDENTLNRCFIPIDWEKVNSILEREKERSLKWLKDALEAPKDLSKVNPADAIIQHLTNKIVKLQDKTVTIEGLNNVLEYNKNYRKYVKYKVLKNFVFGAARDRYKRKQKIYHEKIKSARRTKRGIAGA